MSVFEKKKNEFQCTVQVHCLHLQEKFLNLLLDGGDLRFDLRTLILGHTGSNYRPGDTTNSTQGLLGPNEHVGNVLILAQQRDVEQNLQGLAVGGQNDELCLSSVQSLGGLIGSLPELLVVAGLLNQV